ncbi:hypothetical protein J19TS2_18920 [Cohnella xylanilytica]|mgnify:CR=1 FL=1|nr:hypothetical protein J19TS2_18920 [Cohnella xylanilytica]
MMNPLITILLLLLSLFSENANQKVYVNDGSSMAPTINDGDKLIVSLDKSKGIDRDELIIFEAEDRSFCKRVIGIEGDIIKITQTGVIVNDKNAYGTEVGDKQVTLELTLKQDELFVLGDNIENSKDSRVYGPIKENQVVGIVTRIKHIQR